MKRPLSPTERREAARAIGEGMFSALQLKNYKSEKELKKKRMHKGTLEVEIPDSWNKKASFTGNVLHKQVNNVSGIAESGLNIHQGFKDAAREYERQQQERLAAEIAAAEQEYLQVLSQRNGLLNKTSAAETPLFDAFCVGMAADLEKVAYFDRSQPPNLDDVDMTDESLMAALGALRRRTIDPVFAPVAEPLGTAAIGTGAAAAAAAYAIRNELNANGGIDRNDLLVPQRIALKSL